MAPMQTDQRLRALIGTRRRQAGLTQVEAAHLARIDPGWWKKLESGRATRTHDYTVAAMLNAVGVDPDEVLRYPDLASLMKILAAGEAESEMDVAERYLLNMPGTTDSERIALVRYFRRLRQPLPASDPYAETLRRLLGLASE